MNAPNTLTKLAFCSVLIGATSCGMFSKPATGPEQVESFIGWIERVHVDSELAKERALTAVDALQAIMRAKYEGDALVAYDDLVATVEQSERQAGELNSSVDPMISAAEPVFERWEDDLDSFSNPAMRERSEARLEATRARYEAILAVVEPARERLTVLNEGLRDHVVFLANDFNPQAVAAIRGEANKLVTLSLEIEKNLNECLVASREYIENAALPMSLSVNAAPMTETGSKARSNDTRRRSTSGWAKRPDERQPDDTKRD